MERNAWSQVILLSSTSKRSLKKARLEKTICGNFSLAFPVPSIQMLPDVERYLRESSIEFAKKNQSVTYIVLSRDNRMLIGYFTLAIKPISVNASSFSNTMRRKIERVSEVNEQTGEYLLSAYLIAQLGKNFCGGINEQITGEQLIELALDKIRDVQFRLGGTTLFLEADDEPKLIAFYERNGFKRFAVRKRRGGEHQRKLIQLLKVM